MKHPYEGLPDSQHWIRAVSKVLPAELDPVSSVPFTVSKEDKVATAGSCFAQHIARHLSSAGFNYFVTESLHPAIPHPFFDAATLALFNYGAFTARFGNLYTARQLLQLHKRAYGEFIPISQAWRDEASQYVDPFRPQIQPGGFSSLAELNADREQHLGAVRRAFEELDVFVFTLGLTECYYDSRDEAVYPIAPGVTGGEYDPAIHIFKNFTTDEVVSDLKEFIERLRQRNTNARVILTVSPVPLMATAEPRHVLLSTVLSKSVLRVACDVLSNGMPQVAYFPSYEIITGSFNRGEYFASDLRSVREEGVSHVMRIFMRHFAQGSTELNLSAPCSSNPNLTDEFEKLAQVICDEEVLRNA